MEKRHPDFVPATDVRLTFTDAEGLAHNSDEALIVLDITRHEIESGNIASVLERLHVLTDSAENVRRYREALVFQIEGYDDDPRELPEIAEARAFFSSVMQKPAVPRQH